MSDIIVIQKEDLRALIAEEVRSAIAEQSSKDKPQEGEREQLIDRKQTAALLKISLPTLHNYMKQGKLKPRQIGRRTLFFKSEVLASLVTLSR